MGRTAGVNESADRVQTQSVDKGFNNFNPETTTFHLHGHRFPCTLTHTQCTHTRAHMHVANADLNGPGAASRSRLERNMDTADSEMELD